MSFDDKPEFFHLIFRLFVIGRLPYRKRISPTRKNLMECNLSNYVMKTYTHTCCLLYWYQCKEFFNRFFSIITWLRGTLLTWLWLYMICLFIKHTKISWLIKGRENWKTINVVGVLIFHFVWKEKNTNEKVFQLKIQI